MTRSHNRSLTLLGVLAAMLLAACSKKEAAAPESATVATSPAAESVAIAKSANVHPFTIGSLTAISLLDGRIELPNDNKVFGVGRTPEEVAAVLAGAGLPTDKLALTIEPLVVRSGDRVLMFDAGAGTLFGPGSGLVLGSMKEAGIDPASVTDVFISHSHGDHVGGLVNAQGTLTFPNATIHISAAEWQHMGTEKDYGPLVAAMKPKVQAFAPDAELVPGVVKAVDIKGHTPGHSGFRITSGSESLLYVGDSMHHYVVSVQKPEWTIAFDGDSPVASKSRADLIAQSAMNGQRIYAVHFPFPGVGKFEKQGEKVVWVGE